MAVTTARLRKQRGQAQGMLELYTRNGAQGAIREVEERIKRLDAEIAEREGPQKS